MKYNKGMIFLAIMVSFIFFPFTAFAENIIYHFNFNNSNGKELQVSYRYLHSANGKALPTSIGANAPSALISVLPYSNSKHGYIKITNSTGTLDYSITFSIHHDLNHPPAFSGYLCEAKMYDPKTMTYDIECGFPVLK